MLPSGTFKKGFTKILLGFDLAISGLLTLSFGIEAGASE